MRTTATFNEISEAFFFVSSESYGMHSAILCKDTGKIYYQSEMSDLDETVGEELDMTNCVRIPHKNDLDLGSTLVFDFVQMYMPDHSNRVEQFFRARGAYSRFKTLLDSQGMLQKWYDFEKQRQEEVLREWCEENRIEFSE